jgi:hypothetical protein
MPARRRTLTDRGVAALRPREARYAFPDPELRGHYIRIQPTGASTSGTISVAIRGTAPLAHGCLNTDMRRLQRAE